jgi:hypothetical protein
MLARHKDARTTRRRYPRDSLRNAVHPLRIPGLDGKLVQITGVATETVIDVLQLLQAAD